MKVHLQYGTDGLDVDIPSSNVTVLSPKFVPGLPDEAGAFRAAVREPINSRPLKDLVRAADRVAVVIPDSTRPFPSDRVLPWLFEELSHVPAERFTILNGTGSHRVNTPEELARMVGEEVSRKYRIVNHNAHDPATLAPASLRAATVRERSNEPLADARGSDAPVLLNRDYVAADKRIILGFIEPHFMAGFSGGYKAVFPGVADIASIMRYHSAQVIGDPRSTWGLLQGNPTQALVRANGSLLPVDFCINVTLNRRRRITRFFCGETLAAHDRGCAFSKETAMVPCRQPFPVVITTNSGYPLDQNLYQSVKGMSAAAQVVTKGGFILAAARCNDGFPDHGNFRRLLHDHPSPQAILNTILAPGFSMYDQWEAQLLALICLKARVGLYSALPAADVRRAHLEPVADIAARIAAELDRVGRDTPIAVLPEGPMTIPYLEF
ncbi:MAG: nickel-dependent lactate racemase [Planctomycetota bacterium]|nr:nickel-dependent lactate racemase [Planctomycetota bacterium]